MLQCCEKVVQDVAACICDRCQPRLTPDDHPDWEEKLSVSFNTGYSSNFGDGKIVEIDLCPQCVKETLGAWIRLSTAEWVSAGTLVARGITDSDAGSSKPAKEVPNRPEAKDRTTALRLAELGGSQPGIKGAPRNRR